MQLLTFEANGGGVNTITHSCEVSSGFGPCSKLYFKFRDTFDQMSNDSRSRSRSI